MLLLVGSASASAQYYSSQYRMVIRTIDGLAYPFNVERVDSVYFEMVQSEANGNDEDETTVTGGATEITNYTATITSWANILDNLSSDIKVGIIYTTEGIPSKSNGTQITVSTSSLGSDAKYTVTLENLSQSTTYYYRSFVYQSGIWFYGDVKEFTTKGLGAELVSGEVSKLTCYSAKVNCSVNIDESIQYSTLTYGICYGTDTVPTVNDSKVQANTKDQDGNFSCQFRALTGSTTYYYRAYAYVDGYLSYGSIRSFTTKADDVVITGDIDPETFTVKSALKIGGGAYSTLELGVCYGTNKLPTVSDQIVTANEVDDENNFTIVLKDIPFGIFYYRAFVMIDSVAHYGAVKSSERVMPDDYAVDLGLSVKWATFNVGATKPEEYGGYYAWGETDPQADYSWSTYKWCNGSERTMTKYCNNSEYGNNGFTDTKTRLDPEDDVAHVKWGGNWRMPTKAERDELLDYCTWTWYDSCNTEFNGVAGYKVTSKIEGYTDRFIFLPAAGWRDDTTLYYAGSTGNYGSSSLYTDAPYYAWYLLFSSGSLYRFDDNRFTGRSVRPVCPSEEWLSLVEISMAKEKTLLVGSNAALSVVVKKNNEVYYYDDIEWNSDNPSVAIVDQNGVVTAMSAGIAHITASIQTVSVQCTVTVTDNEDIEHEYVDLGLSVKWATFNVGALSPEDLGAYYAWGETEPKTDYSWSTYKWCNGSSNTLTKYCNNSSYGNNGFTDNKTTLDPEDDVANVKWGGSWRMPTQAELDELRNNCTWTWYGSGNSEFNGIAGYKVTSNKAGYTDCSIFLPAAGSRGYYWSSSLYTAWNGSPDNAYVGFYSGGWSSSGRYFGCSVRPVCPVNVESIAIDCDDLSFLPGTLHSLKALVNGAVRLEASINWSSDNESVATVNSKGMVTALSSGTAHITASIQTLSAQCTVTVIEESNIEHHYVDLGLSVKWATFNVGATKPEEYGGYYSWSETNPQADYSWSTYKWCNGSSSTLTKYNTKSSYGTVDNKTTLDPEDDVAHVKWGGNWRMPTKAEQDELQDSCTWTWYDSGNTEFNGVVGYKVTSKIEGYTDRSIFLPAAGYRSGTDLVNFGSDGFYWSSSLYTNSPYNAYDLYVGRGYSDWRDDNRFTGRSVRPVCPSEEWLSSVSVSLVEDNKTLLVGGNAALSVVVKKNNEVYYYDGIEWNSDNPSVAIVDQNGVVTAMSAGIAHITASIQTISAQCTVTVTDNEFEIEHEYVDLGLSVKWATFNVGALSPEDFGAYYAWGETETKSSYTWTNYKFWISTSIDLDGNLVMKCSKYNTNSRYGTVDNKITLDPEDDVAHIKWGGSWRMPTKAEQDELRNNCTWTWYDSGNTEFNGIAGYKVTSNKAGYTDRFIFLPAGYRGDSNLSDVGSYYWSSSLYTNDPDDAYSLYFDSDDVYTSYGSRGDGFSVRPVCPSEEWLSSVSVSLEDNKTLMVGGSAVLNVTVIQNNEVLSRAPDIWFSDNPAVAIIDNDGVVTALSAGTAHITASIQTLSAQCIVTVIEESDVKPEYVDLGLSVKWATFNVGALSPEDLGAYYAWGEIETKSYYSWSTYKWCNGSYNTQTKYNTKSSYGTVDNKTTLDPEDDVAHVKWGGSWRMPTKAEQDELRNNCTWTWYDSGNTEFNGIAGYKVTSNKAGYTDRFIFLPAAGCRDDTYLDFVGIRGYYWSSSLYTDGPSGAYYLYFLSDYVYWYDDYRDYGRSVRPVCP